eukprot:6163541-Pyramimonas_sp.AAC.1
MTVGMRMQSEKAVNRKRAKYRLLVLGLHKAGWNVVEMIHVVTVGVRGTVLQANRAELPGHHHQEGAAPSPESDG